MAEVSTSVQHITALDFDITKAEQQIVLLETKIEQITKKIANSNWTIKTAIQNQKDIDSLKTQLDEAKKKYVELQNKMNEMATQGIASTSRLASTIESRLVFALRNVAREAASTVKEVESAMVDISRVMQLTANETDNLRDSLFDLGNEYGRSFEDVADISLRFAQAGYDMTDNISLTKDALLALNTAELDSEEATQSLIGILSQWGYKAEDLITIIDKLNYTADNNAITTQDLIDGLLKASSMARTAGMSFDDTVGILTSMKVASGAAGKEVGNAFKSIMAYIQRPESLKLFESMGIDVFADKVTGELLPMMDILENMSAKWNENQEGMLDTLVSSGDALQMMSEEWAIATDSMEEYTKYQEAMTEATNKANTAEARAQAQAAAGVYRRNYYISLMENLNQAQQVSNDLMNAEGHSAQENARYMETLGAKVEQLVVALKELAVTAADAGLLDLAKGAIETATTFTKLTTDTKTLVPLLGALAGVMVIIKQQKLATELTAIRQSFTNAGTAIENSILTLKGVATSANTATAATTGLSGAIGALGLALGAISLAVGVVITAISNYNQKLDETIEKGKEASNSFDALIEATKQYNELSTIVERTVEQENDYKNVQEEIIGLIGGRSEKLKGLIKGTEDYNEALKEQIRLELQSQQADIINASNAAYKKMENTEYWKTTGLYGVDYGSEVHKALEKTGKIVYTPAGNASINYEGNTALETYANLSELVDILDGRLSELEQTNSELADEFADDRTYKKLKENYEQLNEAAEDYLAAEVKRQSISYILENGIPETVQQQEKMNKAVLDGINTTDKLTDEILDLITVYGTFNQEQADFYKIFKESNLPIEQLKEMAKSGELNTTVLGRMLDSNSDFASSMKSLGVTTGEAVQYIYELAESEKTVAEASGEAGKGIEDFAKDLETAETKISSLNKYIQTLGEGNGLTAEQVLELVDTYGLLLDQFTLTEQGYTIEVSALEKLREAQVQSAVSARNSQIEQTQVLQEGLLDRIKAYGLEIDSIANLAEAQAGLADIEKKRAEKANDISSESEYKYYKEQLSDMDATISTLKDIAAKYEDTEKNAEEFYKALGTSFEETKKSGEETVDILKEITEGYEHLVSLGLYSTEEQIAYYENLRRTLSLTEEQYQSLESTLHKLYTTQLEESKEAIEAEYEAQKKAIEEKYELDKENREEYWDNELDRIKGNLNSQIDSAKKAYEERKKLADKSYDNQKEALESLRDTEIEGIEASYNAQIEALEKIKAARQAERDEADYQDERAELLEQISYYEQRTGTEAVEQLADLRKQLADLDEERRRELEDEEIDTQIDELEKQRDDEASAIKKQYEAQIAALQASQETELEMYEATYEREIELLENRLEKETEALEKKRDEDLKRLEDEKEAAIKSADDRWAAIEAIFEERNLAMIASAGMFAPELYDKFHELFTEKFKMDLDELSSLMGDLQNRSGSFSFASGTKPVVSVPKSVTSKVKNTEETSSGGFSVGTQVKVSGTVYGDSYGKNPGTSLDGKKTTITRINSGGSKPYHVGNLGWVDESQLVKARTGGMTTADGLAMLHKDELIVNPPLTQKLEDLLDALVPQGEVVISPAIMKDLKQMADYYNRPQVYNTSNSNTDNHSKTVAVNINGPLQNIERVEDMADMNAVINSLGREIMRKVGTML